MVVVAEQGIQNGEEHLDPTGLVEASQAFKMFLNLEEP